MRTLQNSGTSRGISGGTRSHGEKCKDPEVLVDATDGAEQAHVPVLGELFQEDLAVKGRRFLRSGLRGSRAERVRPSPGHAPS